MARQPTIYEALRDRLGREPTHREQCGEVLRILREARDGAAMAEEPPKKTEWSEPPADYDYLDEIDNGDCWNCGGEGYVWDCFDGCCRNAEDGCRLCTRRCDVCNPAPRKPAAEPAKEE